MTRAVLLALAVVLISAAPVEAKGKAQPRLVIMRHGESTANRNNRFAGSKNVKLTPRGASQARRAGRGLRGIRFDKAYSSSLDRASSTLRLALAAAGQVETPRVKTGALNERRYGVLEGRDRARAAEIFGAARLDRWRLSWDEGPPGGESLEQVSKRAVGFLDRKVMADLAAGKNVLLTSHKHTIRALVGHLEGLSEKELEELEIGNAEPIVYRLGKDGKLRREKSRRSAP